MRVFVSSRLNAKPIPKPVRWEKLKELLAERPELGKAETPFVAADFASAQ
jgi:hypothetical protein